MILIEAIHHSKDKLNLPYDKNYIIGLTPNRNGRRNTALKTGNNKHGECQLAYKKISFFFHSVGRSIEMKIICVFLLCWPILSGDSLIAWFPWGKCPKINLFISESTLGLNRFSSCLHYNRRKSTET